jgi:glutathione-specific gamma-glutamylcyclotransferase
MWIFGYGSLIWKTEFEFEEKVLGYVEGYVRRFWQGSHDHRGTPERPGRVVTLISKAQHEELYPNEPFENKVWGTAYKINSDNIEEVRNYLDYREKNGYSLEYVRFWSIDHCSFNALLYIASPNNEAFLGPKPPNEIVNHILTSAGPSGPGYEYLFHLILALHQHWPEEALQNDLHLMGLLKESKAWLMSWKHELLWTENALVEFDSIFKLV